jgi:hypothetical protein
MNAGVTSITALMAKTDLDGEVYVAEYGEEEYVKLVAAYSLYIGLASVLLALVGFGKLAQKVPKTVRSGFKVSTFGHCERKQKSCTARLYHSISSVYSGVVLSVYLYQLYQTVCLLVVAES